MSDVSFSIVLPVHNQADHIETLIGDYARSLDTALLEYELLLVVNGSHDQSRKVCDALAERNARIRVFEEAVGGWGRAVKRGIREARGTHICYTNSARTTNRDLLLLLLYAQSFPETIVKANRKIRESFRRRLGSLLYNLECRALFDLSCWDINGTPKVFPRSFHALLELRRDDDLIDAEFVAVSRRHEYPLIEVPIFSTRRHGGKSTTNYRSALNMYLGALMLARDLRRSR